MPWECSCLEVFLSDGGTEKQQLCIRHDGVVFQVKNGVAEECSSVKIVPGGRNAESFRFRAEIPLSLIEGCREEPHAFSFDFQQSVMECGRVLRGVFCGSGGGNISEFATALVP